MEQINSAAFHSFIHSFISIQSQTAAADVTDQSDVDFTSKKVRKPTDSTVTFKLYQLKSQYSQFYSVISEI